MHLTSNDFADGDYLGAVHILSADFGFGCAGGNQSPHLAWSDVPEGTSFFPARTACIGTKRSKVTNRPSLAMASARR